MFETIILATIDFEQLPIVRHEPARHIAYINSLDHRIAYKQLAILGFVVKEANHLVKLSASFIRIFPVDIQVKEEEYLGNVFPVYALQNSIVRVAFLEDFNNIQEAVFVFQRTVKPVYVRRVDDFHQIVRQISQFLWERPLQTRKGISFRLLPLQHNKYFCGTQSNAPARNILGILRACRSSFSVLDESGPST